ncbi:hypothetical protein AMECASPLE_030294 [Ameca splendens]|uniref:Uncharacterized protein n=1 Tax=Ameca splendens TaxID=208324 RepID=A0ABV0XIZ6_9TELE
MKITKIVLCHSPLRTAEGACALQKKAELSRAEGMTSLSSDVGPLSARADLWHACAVSPWVLPTISKGYKLLFAMTPLSALFSYQLGFSTCPGRQNCIPSRQKSDQSNTK